MPAFYLHLWQARLERYVKTSTQGKLTDVDRKQALQDKLGIYWRMKVTEQCKKELTKTSYREMCDAIVHSMRKQLPVGRARADLLGMRKADGRSARRQYGHIKDVARYTKLEDMKVEQLLIFLTINSLDHGDQGLREKVLEAVDNNEDEMKEEMFKKILSEHEKELEDSGNRRHEDRKRQTCWCCGDSTHRKSECPNRERAFCNRCNTRGHFDNACSCS